MIRSTKEIGRSLNDDYGITELTLGEVGTYVWIARIRKSLIERNQTFTDGELGQFGDAMIMQFVHYLLAVSLNSLYT